MVKSNVEAIGSISCFFFFVLIVDSTASRWANRALPFFAPTDFVLGECTNKSVVLGSHLSNTHKCCLFVVFFLFVFLGFFLIVKSSSCCWGGNLLVAIVKMVVVEDISQLLFGVLFLLYYFIFICFCINDVFLFFFHSFLSLWFDIDAKL